MTLTTEQLRVRAESLGLDFFIEQRAGGWVKEWNTGACVTANAQEVEMWLLLANRDAQPVAYLNKFSGICMTLEQQPNAADDAAVYVPLYTAPPAPDFPERLPCPVHLLPGLKFGKGVPTRSMLDALVRRAEYESEREAMTPEQKAEDDARIEAFKALLPRPPAPAVNTAPDFEAWFVEKYKQPERLIKNYDGTYKFSGVHMAFSAWSDGRSAMLAQPVSGSYTLNSPVIPDGWIACSEQMPTPFVDVIASDGKQTFTAHFIDEADWWCLVSQLAEEPGDVTHWIPLPAAPEGGNDHDTRR